MDGMDDDVRTILDCFSGADGGGSFVDFLALYAEMKRRAGNDDKAALKVVEQIRRFARFIRLASKR